MGGISGLVGLQCRADPFAVVRVLHESTLGKIHRKQGLENRTESFR